MTQEPANRLLLQTLLDAIGVQLELPGLSAAIIKSRRWRQVEELLLAGADPNVIGDGGIVPLHCAAAINDQAVCALLLERGANPLAKSLLGNTPVDRAIIENARESLVVLLQYCHELPLTASKKALVEMCFEAPFSQPLAQVLVDHGLGKKLRAYARRQRLQEPLAMIQAAMARRTAAAALLDPEQESAMDLLS